MISINKIKTQSGDWIRINTDDGSFEIDYCGNHDLYWKYVFTSKNFIKQLIITEKFH